MPEALPEGLVAASIKMFRDEKNFGFVRVDGVKGDVFFHGSSVASNVALAPGMKVKVHRSAWTAVDDGSATRSRRSTGAAILSTRSSGRFFR